MNTLEDLKKYILAEYGVNPVSFDGKVLEYRAITFKRATGSVLVSNKKTNDMWVVQRRGHSIDYFRTLELEIAVSPGGSLLYFFMPESRI